METKYDKNDTKIVNEEDNNNVAKESISESQASREGATINTNKDSFPNTFLLVCIVGVSLGILLEIVNVLNKNHRFSRESCADKKKYWVYSAYNDVENKNGLLKHVHLVLERSGFEISDNKTHWNLLWSHDYPFRALYPNLHRLKPEQKVNHFPGTGFITNKVDLATTDSRFIPKAFKLPKNKDDFLKYAKENRNSWFLEKHNKHRGVYLKNVSEIDSSSGESFVQEYVQKPFLVDGHKFDIGVYVVVTSVNPLRVYWYKGDVLFRYCPAKYYPFDPKNLDKYVVADDYLPTWELPSLAHYYTALGHSMKEAFDAYARSKGKDTEAMWAGVQTAIAEVFFKKEHHIVQALKQYPAQNNFFEMMRFDLVVDEDLKVYLLEANMSPNLSSAHFSQNQLLYEQVIYNLLSITGVTTQPNVNDAKQREMTAARNMISSQKNIAVFSQECSTICKDTCEAEDICQLCKPCLTARLKNSLLQAHTEFLHRGNYRRLIPKTMIPQKDITNLAEEVKHLTANNKLQYIWYQGKCNEDITWCS